MVLVQFCAEAAQPMKRGDKNSNLAVMLAYRPNSEIQMKDKHNKSWTYKIQDDDESAENINEQLLEALIKENFAKRFNPNAIDDRRTVKRENKFTLAERRKRQESESHESHEIDDAKIVEVGSEDDKKTCYKNTYKNVLNAFETALKSQIENYKKCVCQKKTTTTTTTTEAPTTESEMTGKNTSDEDDDNKRFNNPTAIASALDHTDDIICFHKQYAFMLNNLLDRIPCDSKKDRVTPVNNPSDDEHFKGESVKRAERNNKNFIAEYQDLEADSESVEIDVSELTPKPKSTTTSKPIKKVSKAKKSEDDQSKMNQRILAILNEVMESKNADEAASKKPEKKQKVAPKKITIKAKRVAQSEESEEETNMPEESEEFSQQQFVKQLRELFQKYQVDSDETFPVQSEERFAESTTSVPARKSTKKPAVKIAVTQNTVAESSDESAEISAKLKNRKLEKERHQLRENSRKSTASRSNIAAINHNAIDSDSKPKKSYRNSPRTDDERNHSAEIENVPTAKKSQRASKSSRASADDRLATDFAKKISDFARGKPHKKVQ